MGVGKNTPGEALKPLSGRAPASAGIPQKIMCQSIADRSRDARFSASADDRFRAEIHVIRRGFSEARKGRFSACAVAALQHAPEQVDILVHAGIGLTQFVDLADGVNHRGVVATAEFAANLGQRAGGELLR